MQELTIVANIIAKGDTVDLVKTELSKLVAMSREEQGCLRYDLHQDNENGAHFLIYETWETHGSWQAHRDRQHYKAYIAATKGSVDHVTVNQMTKTTVVDMTVPA